MIRYITADGLQSPWVGVELRAVRDRGIPATLTSMRPCTKNFFGDENSWAARLLQETQVLYPLAPLAVAAAVLAAPFRFRGKLLSATANALFGRREHARARAACLWHLVVAIVWATSLRRDPTPTTLIHAHWIHAPGSIGMYAAWLLGVPFSFTGHAVDLFRDRVALDDKIHRAEFIVCISTFHRDLYLERGKDPSALEIVHCGIDPDEIQPAAPDSASDPQIRRRVVSFARLSEKKGFDVLIDAVSALRQRGVDVCCTIGGSGPDEQALREQIARLNLADSVELTGAAVLQDEIPAFVARGAVFAQPCVVAADGDRDGTPRSLMEAMLCGVPVVSTRVAGIPDIVQHESTGLLCDERDVAGLADAIQRLLESPELATSLATHAREHILEEWSLPHCIDPLIDRFSDYDSSDGRTT